jgi:hypothetical protein
MIGRLFTQFCLDGIEELSIENGGLLTLQYLTLEADLSNIETITKEVRQRSPRKVYAANRLGARPSQFVQVGWHLSECL